MQKREAVKVAEADRGQLCQHGDDVAAQDVVEKAELCGAQMSEEKKRMLSALDGKKVALQRRAGRASRCRTWRTWGGRKTRIWRCSRAAHRGSRTRCASKESTAKIKPLSSSSSRMLVSVAPSGDAPVCCVCL